MKKFAQRKKIHVPIYDVSLYIVITNDMLLGMSRLPKVLHAVWEDTDSMNQAIFFDNFPYYGIVFDKGSINTGLVQHEAGHFVRQLMHDIGHTITAENDEPVAYLEEWVNKEVHKAIL